MTRTAVRLAGGQGFYGDSPQPLADVLTSEPDYVVLEGLAELTLAILQKDRQRDETLGYNRDLPAYLRMLLPAVAGRGMKVITNAGGINPVGAARVVTQVAQELGLSGLRIATVLGDDILGRPELRPSDFPGQEQLLFANAYLGARPLVQALEQDADVVVTGRVADAALFLAPLAHVHGWSWDDWDRLAAGIVVGHLLECSGQTAGGNHAGRWWEIEDPWRFAFPLADVEPDGSATLFKSPGTGGRVDFDTVRQQLLYEVHDPSAYLSPDVVVDMSTVRLDDLGGDRVRVSGATGAPATGRYKVVGAVPDGFLCDATIAFGWPDAGAKARAAADIARKRVEVAGLQVDEWRVELFGVNALHGPAVPAFDESVLPEVVLRLAWRCGDQATAGRVARELTPMSLSSPPPHSTHGSRARPRPSAGMRICSGLVDRAAIDEHVRVAIEKV